MMNTTPKDVAMARLANARNDFNSLEEMGAKLGGRAIGDVAYEPKQLERIADLAVRIQVCNTSIEGFLDRFEGLDCAAQDSSCSPAYRGHSGQIARLADAVTDLETMVTRLIKIG